MVSNSVVKGLKLGDHLTYVKINWHTSMLIPSLQVLRQ